MYAALQRPTRRSVTGGESISSALESTIAQFLGMIRDVAMQHTSRRSWFGFLRSWAHSRCSPPS